MICFLAAVCVCGVRECAFFGVSVSTLMEIGAFYAFHNNGICMALDD